MAWDIARRMLRCTSNHCSTEIVHGEKFRWIAGGHWAICAACAKRRLGEDPPADLRAPTVRGRTLQPMAKIADVVDFKIAQYEPKAGGR